MFRKLLLLLLLLVVVVIVEAEAAAAAVERQSFLCFNFSVRISVHQNTF